MKTRTTGALLGVLVAFALGGCGGEQPRATATAARPPRAPGLKIVMIAKNNTNPVFVSARKGADTAARQLAATHNIPIDVVWMTPNREDGELQATAIAQAVTDGADAILISCSDPDKVSSAIDQAVARGVAVMTFDSDAAKSKRFAFYGVDDEKLGQTVMRELATRMRGGGAVAILAGNADAPNLRKRVEGVTKEAGRQRGIKIVGTFHHAETPADAAAEVIREQAANPQIKGWAMVGGWALSTPRLMTELDPKKVTVVAVNALPAQLPYIENGIAPVLLALPTFDWGYVSVNRIVDKVHLKKDVPEILPPMEVVPVTKDNLGTWTQQLKTWGFALPDKYAKLK